MKGNTYPVNLLLAGKRCLIVGGGKIASRKISGLIESEADITVVASKINSVVRELIEGNNLSFYERDFEESDLDNAFIVFAATNDRALNKRIIDICISKNILVCAIDENWVDGHFIRPASFMKNGVRVAVSTDGMASRRTRLIKESLARHVDIVDRAELFIIGTDHNYLGIGEREPCHLTGKRYDKVGTMLTHVWGLHEFFLLNTCNRVELAAIISPSDGLEDILKHIMGFSLLDDNSYYIKYGKEAFKHLATVAAGLMSQTPGEKHITSQLKEAISIAEEKEWSSGMMRQWMDTTLHLSKHIRNEMEPHLHDFEIEDLALQFIESETADLKSANALVLGTGVIGKNIVERLSPLCAEITWCYHVNKPEKDSVKGVELCNLNELKEKLPDADIIVCATSASVPLIHHGHAPFMDQSKPIMVIDLAIPRNVSPELEKLMANLKIVDLDDLKYWRRREVLDMSLIFEISNRIINEHKDFYEKIIYNFQGRNKSQQTGADSN
jgi:glutamyl-tRNA reductase